MSQLNFKNPIVRKATVVILIIIVVIALYYFYGNLFRDNSSEYQAVFLINGQVYFGKAANLNSNYVELTDIYYLQLKSALQPQEPPAATPDKNSQQLVLMKLGNELHGPQDKMLINREQILFIEDLKSDSQVVSAIKKNKNK